MLKDSLQDLEKNDHFNSLVPETPIDRRSFIAAAGAWCTCTRRTSPR